MESFSWVDMFHAAVNSCLPCFSSNTTVDPSGPPSQRIPRARPDELLGLLAESVTDINTDFDALSMYSNPGNRGFRSVYHGKRSSRKKLQLPVRKQIRLFGYDLFGRPGGSALGPIHLTDSDDEVEEGSVSSSGCFNGRSLPLQAGISISSSTFDSDAAPLDLSTIDQISKSSLPVSHELRKHDGEELLRSKRRAEKSERRERLRLSRMLDGSASAGGEFEGFQGSGDGIGPHPYSSAVMELRLPSSVSHAPESDICKDSQDSEVEVDFGGAIYMRGEGDRSRTTASHCDRVASACAPETPSTAVPASCNQRSQTTVTTTKMMTSTTLSPSRVKKKKRSATSRSTTSGSTSQSASLSSPTSLSFPSFSIFPHYSGTSSLTKADEFDGSQGLTMEDLPSVIVQSEVPAQRNIGIVLDREFPQTRLGPPGGSAVKSLVSKKHDTLNA